MNNNTFSYVLDTWGVDQSQFRGHWGQAFRWFYPSPRLESPHPWWCLFSDAMICRTAANSSAANDDSKKEAGFRRASDQWGGLRSIQLRKGRLIQLSAAMIRLRLQRFIEAIKAEWGKQQGWGRVSSRDYRSPPGCQHLIFPKLGENWSRGDPPKTIFFFLLSPFDFFFIQDCIRWDFSSWFIYT